MALNLFDLTPAEQFAALESGKIDLGFVGLQRAFSGQNLRSDCVAHDTILVALAEDHPLAKKPRVKLADLDQQFFVGMSATIHPGAREWLLEVCRRAGFEGKILQEADVEPTAIRFVADGLGFALLPEQVTGLLHEGVVFLPLSPPLRQESAAAWWADNSSQPLKDYVKIVRTCRCADGLISRAKNLDRSASLSGLLPERRSGEPVQGSLKLWSGWW